MMRLLRSYFFWSYERGSIQYDVMVSVILVFIFVAPRFIDFKDKPVTTIPFRSSEVLVKSSGSDGHMFTYEVSIDDVGETTNEAELDAALLRIIEPIAGEVTLEHTQPVLDLQGKVVAYNAIVRR